MAGREPSIPRRRVLGAAAAISVLAFARPVIASAAKQSSFSSAASALWNRRLARYQRLAIQAETAATTGWFRAANDRYTREMAEITARFGGDDRPVGPEFRRLRLIAFRRVSKAENAYWHRCTAPMQKAAVALVLTPAPDLAALGAKLAVLRAHQLHELDSMTRDAFEVLEEDARALQHLAGRGQSP